MSTRERCIRACAAADATPAAIRLPLGRRLLDVTAGLLLLPLGLAVRIMRALAGEEAVRGLEWSIDWPGMLLGGRGTLLGPDGAQALLTPSVTSALKGRGFERERPAWSAMESAEAGARGAPDQRSVVEERASEAYRDAGAGFVIAELVRLLPSLPLALLEARGGYERRIRVAGVRVDNLTMEEAVKAVLRLAESGGVVQFVNAHCVNVASRRPDYAEALEEADLVLPDGSGVRIAAALCGTPVKENVNGTDLAPILLERAAELGLDVFLLGGRPGVAAGAARRIAQRWPGLEISGVEHGYHDEEGWRRVEERIARVSPSILLVALGVPRQELWIRDFHSRRPRGVKLGVGGLLDFLSGRIPRAPRWMRDCGMEWVWRLIQEPARMWRRYLVGNVEFMLRVLAGRWKEGRR